MKKINTVLLVTFHFINLILIITYLYPGSIAGCIFYKNCTMEPQITKDFLVSSNHFYAFIFLSSLGILAYYNTKKINFLIKYLFVISIILEFFHIIHPYRKFEFIDLFGNIIGVLLVVAIYKFKKKYV